MKSYIIFLLFIVCVVVGCAAGKIVGNRIVHERRSFECSLLSDNWRITSNDPYSKAPMQFRHKDGTWITIFVWRAEKPFRGLKDMGILNTHLELVAKSRNNFKLLHKGTINIYGLRAGWGIVEYDYPKANRPMKAKVTDVNFEGNCYSIYLYADKKNFEKHLTEYDDFVRTFKFIRK